VSTVLSNRLATFTFESDGSTGMRLANFESAVGSKTWINSDARLWRAKVFDSTGVDPNVLPALDPTFAQFSAGPITVDATGKQMILRWTAIPMPAGTDKLDVTLTLRLNDNEDWLRARISAAWNGAATRFSLDSIAPLPLAIGPHNAGYDAAVVPCVEGIISREPLSFLRDPFERDYPTAVGGWSMALWGYYERLTKQGWMLWLDDNQLETIRIQWTSDGAAVKFLPLQYQPNNLEAGNTAAALGSLFTFCLRPMTIRTRHGWKDMGKFYRQRLEANPQSWFKPVRTKRSDFSAQEKKFTIFCDMSANDTTHLPTQPGLTDALMDAIRTGSLAPAPTPILMLLEFGSYRIDKVNETATVGDLRTQIQSIYTNKNTFTVCWFPGGPWPSSTLSNGVQPGGWSVHRWFNESGGGVDSDDLRWWTTNDILGGMRMSRLGKLQGGGSDRLGERPTAKFYRERIYPITAWNPGTRTATVTGTPNADGFVGTLNAVVMPASGAARLGIALVTALGATTVQVAADFVGGDDVVVTPAPGDSLVVFIQDNGDTNPCPHAVTHSADHLRQLKRNTTKGTAKLFRQSGTYLDTWAPPQMRLGLDFQQFCYRDHTGWSKIDGGYVPHPRGGGAWLVRAWKDIAVALKQAGRDAQVALGGPSFYWLTGEGIAEPLMEEFDMNFHRCGSGGLWQGSPVPNKWLAVPLMSVTHAGRFFSRGLNQEFSSAALNAIAPFNDPELHLTMAYWLAYEWPYGAVMPVLSFFESTGLPAKNFFDDTLYVSGGGSISNVVKQIRDLWVQITQAETNWLCAEGFRYGEFLGCGEIDPTGTDVTTGRAETTYANIYTSFDVIEDRATTPRVVHGVWRADDGSVRVVMANWTDTSGALSVRLDTEDAGLGAPKSNLLRAVTATRVNSARATQPDVAFDAETGQLSIESLAPFSVAVVILEPADLGDVAGDPRGDECSCTGFSI